MTEQTKERCLEAIDVEGSPTSVLRLLEAYMSYSTTEELGPLLRDAIEERLAAGRTRIVVNLARVGVMDSCGLAVLISLKKMVEARRGKIVLTNLGALLQRLFTITGLERAFEIHATEAQALA